MEMKGFVLCIALLVMLGNQRAISATAEPQYAESILLWVSFDDMTCSVMIRLRFHGVEGPLPPSEFLDEPSFTGMTVSIGYYAAREITRVSIMLDSSKITEKQEDRIAKELKRKTEKALNLYLPYKQTSGYLDTLQYDYEIEDCPPREEIANLLRNSLPQGFGQVGIPLLTSRNVTVDFWLLEGWTITIWCPHQRFNISLDQENTISLKEMTGYSRTIRSAPEASRSTLHVDFLSVPKHVKLQIIETVPPQMEMTQQKGQGAKLAQVSLDADITGSSIDDLSIRFRMVPAYFIEPAALGIILVQLVMIGLCAYIVLKKPR